MRTHTKSVIQNLVEVARLRVMNTSSLVPDDLWEAIEPLLPDEPPKPRGGRPRISDRAALAGIVFVLRTGCPWRLLPSELACGFCPYVIAETNTMRAKAMAAGGSPGSSTRGMLPKYGRRPAA